MRRTLWTTTIVLVAAVAVCSLSHFHINRMVNHARHLRTEAILAMDEGEIQQVEEILVELAGYINRNRGWLEVVCEHSDLHEIKANIIDAQASIEFGIEDDFYQAIYRFGECLEHIADVESVRLTNLY